MAPMKAAHFLPLPMRPAGFLLPTLAALAPGFLRCPAITATPYRFSPATRSAAAWPSDALTYSGVEVEVAGCLLHLC